MRGASKRPRSLQRRVDVDRAELVAHHLEMVRRAVDLQIADAQLVRAEAAVERRAGGRRVLDVQRLHGDALAGQGERGRARSCISIRSATTRNPAFAISTLPSRCGSRLVPIAFTSSVISPLTLRTTSVIPSMRPRLIVLDLMARSIGCSGRSRSTGRAAPCRRRDPDARRLIEPRVDVEHLRGVGEPRLQLLVADALDASVGDGQRS